MRRVWGLPANISIYSDIVYLIADSIHIYDELCRVDLLIVCIKLLIASVDYS